MIEKACLEALSKRALIVYWSGRYDSNVRPREPHSGGTPHRGLPGDDLPPNWGFPDPSRGPSCGRSSSIL